MKIAQIIILATLAMAPTMAAGQQVVGGVNLTDQSTAFKKGGVYIDQDRFSGTTTIMGQTKVNIFKPTFSLTQITIDKKSQYFLLITTVNDGWAYLRCKSNRYLLDDKPFKIEGKHDGTVGRGSVRETFTIPMTQEQVAQLTAASKFEFQFCNDEFMATPDDMAMFKDFAKVIASYNSQP